MKYMIILEDNDAGVSVAVHCQRTKSEIDDNVVSAPSSFMARFVIEAIETYRAAIAAQNSDGNQAMNFLKSVTTKPTIN